MLREEEAGLERELDEEGDGDSEDDGGPPEVIEVDDQNPSEEPEGSEESDWFGLGGDEQ